MTTLINEFIEIISSVFTLVLGILPETPFHWNLDSGFLSVINWLIPIPILITQLEVYVIAVSIYYALRIVLRWLKVAGG